MNIQLTFSSRAQPISPFAAVKIKLGELRLHWQQAKLQRQEVARVTRELSEYSDRQLADLGFSRADIPDVARGVFSRA